MELCVELLHMSFFTWSFTGCKIAVAHTGLHGVCVSQALVVGSGYTQDVDDDP